MTAVLAHFEGHPFACVANVDDNGTVLGVVGVEVVGVFPALLGREVHEGLVRDGLPVYHYYYMYSQPILICTRNLFLYVLATYSLIDLMPKA